MKSPLKLAALSLSLLLLTSCIASEEESSPSYQPPGYANVVGDGNFEVNCGMSRMIVSRSSSARFRNEDGTDKTLEEFCASYGSNTRIGR